MSRCIQPMRDRGGRCRGMPSRTVTDVITREKTKVPNDGAYEDVASLVSSTKFYKYFIRFT